MLVSQATELLEGIHGLRRETPSLESELDFLPGLTQLVQTFAEKLERLHNTYMAIHIFFLMFEKVCFLCLNMKEAIPPIGHNRFASQPRNNQSLTSKSSNFEQRIP